MKNAMGQELTPTQAGLVQVYEDLLALVRDKGDELGPFEDRNAKKALGCLWQIANGLDMDPGQLYDIDV